MIQEVKPTDITAILPFCACLINQVQTGKKNTVGYRDPGIDPAVLNSQYTQTFLWLQQYDAYRYRGVFKKY
jgi:hypothetical protein